jgi:hypothetical protein
MGTLTAAEFSRRQESLATAENRRKYEGFRPPDKRNGDVFIGVRMGDTFAINVVGAYLRDKPRTVLYELAKSQDMWQRRTAIVATIALGDSPDTFEIAALLIGEQEDLIQKATGWRCARPAAPGSSPFSTSTRPSLPG